MAVLTTKQKGQLGSAASKGSCRVGKVFMDAVLGDRLSKLDSDGSYTGTISATATNLDLGSTTPTAGSLDVFPAATGGAADKLTITSLTNGGNRGLGIVNRAMGQATSLGIPDPGAAAGEFVLTNSAHQVIFNANGSDRTFALNGNVSFGGAVSLTGALATAAAVTFSGAFAAEIAVPSASTWTLPAGGGTLATSNGASTGTSNATFEINNTGNSLTLSSSGLTGDYDFTFPDGADGVVVTQAATQTLTAKTLTTPVINGASCSAAANNFDFTTSTGTLDTPHGTNTIHGNVASHGNITFSFAGSNGTFATSTGTNTLSGNVVVAPSKTVAIGTAAGGGVANALTLYSATANNGSFVLHQPDNAGDKDTTIQALATLGQDTVYTLADPGAAAGTIPTIQTANIFTAAQTVAIDNATNNGVTDLLVIKHSTSGDPSAGMGAGLSVIVENDSDATTEVSSVDFVMTNDGTKAALDVDVVFNTMLGGTVCPALSVDASDQSLTIGQNVTDADGLNQLRIFPLTTARGSLLVTAVANTGDTVTQITNEAFGQATVITIPDPGAATCNLAYGDGDGRTAAANVANGIADGDATAIGVPFVLFFTSTATGTQNSAAVPAGRKMRVLRASYAMTDAGAAGDAVQLKNSNAAEPVTEALDVSAKSDGDHGDFAKLYDAGYDIAATKTLQCINSSDAKVNVAVLCVYLAP